MSLTDIGHSYINVSSLFSTKMHCELLGIITVFFSANTISSLGGVLGPYYMGYIQWWFAKICFRGWGKVAH